MTRQPDFQAEGSLVVDSVAAALALAESRAETEVFVIGGAEIYAQTLAQADRLYLTFVDAEVAADTFFPAFAATDWQEVERNSHVADEKNQYAFTFVTLTRNR